MNAPPHNMGGLAAHKATNPDRTKLPSGGLARLARSAQYKPKVLVLGNLQGRTATEVSAISREDVEHLARLSRLALTDEELTEFSGQLDKILEHVAAVADVAGADVPAMSHPTAIVNVSREDEHRPSLSPEQALDQAPAQDQQRFQVPQILGEE